MSLPGWFPYYPHAGKSELYDLLCFGFNRLVSDTDAEFELEIKSKQKIYCNLDGAETYYSGKTNGVTIIGGFYDSVNVDGSEVIYPYLSSEEFSKERITNEISSYKKAWIFQ